MNNTTLLLPLRLRQGRDRELRCRTRSSTLSLWRSVCVVVFAGLSACTATQTTERDGTGSESAAPNGDPEGAGGVDRAGQNSDLDQQPEESVDDERVDSVLAAAGYYRVPQDEWDEYLAASLIAQRDQEELVGMCMSEQGFEYFQDELRQTSWQPGYVVTPTGFEWVLTYGLGESTTLFSVDILTPGTVGFVGPGPPPGPDMSEDSPESQYLANLSVEGLREYNLTLEGFDPTAAFSFDDDGELVLAAPDAMSVETIAESCRGQARQIAPEPIQALGSDAQMADRILASPDWVDRETEGWRCLLDQGYEVGSFADAQSLVSEWVAELSDSFGSTDDDDLGDSGLVQEFEEALVEVQAMELELAEELWDCGVHEIQQAERFRDLVLVELG